jgi:hypothetical protein
VTDVVCGNGTCQAGETCANCAQDCTCPSGQTCLVSGTCCAKQCAGKECGSDGCGGNCGTCPTGQSCTPDRRDLLELSAGLRVPGPSSLLPERVLHEELRGKGVRAQRVRR